jgi:hypothetical protein
MRAIQLNQSELEELMGIMAVGNKALKECAEMMNLTHRAFRGQLFNNRLDTSKLSAEQLDKLNTAKPLIFAVRNKCEEQVRAGFRRLVKQQAFVASRNSFDPINTKEEFEQEGEIALLDAIYGYTDTKIKLVTFIWRCVRRRIMAAINRLNPMCPLTNEALNLVRRVQEAQNKNPELTEMQAVDSLGLSDSEREVFFGSVTKVMNERVEGSIEQFGHSDDYTSRRRGVDRDVKEVFFIRDEARQAVKDANLDEFELSCLMAEIFPYTGWKEDVAKQHINKKTGERFTRQNVQYVLERVKKKIREVYENPPETPVENPLVDKFFEEWSAEKAD